MTNNIQGKIKGRGAKIAIVVSKFNQFITERLLEGCLKELSSRGVLKRNILTVYVPGAFEIPVTALRLARKKEIHAVICLGAIIRGETYHYELVCQSAAQGISQAALMTGKPVVFGVLSTETVEQSSRRAEQDGDNKGVEAAVTALEMIDVLSKIK